MTSSRLQSIDFLRGLVIMLMTVDHAREFFYFTVPLPDPMQVEKIDVGTFLSRWLAHFCAPVFVFLTGLSAWLLADRRNLSRRELAWFLLQRGTLFLFLEVTLINYAWTFSLPPEKLFLQVIWAIGLSMICLAGLIWLPWTIQCIIAVSIIAGHNFLDSVEFAPGSVLNGIWALLHDRQTLQLGGISIRTSYPVLPWIGIMGLGYVSGRWFQQAQRGNVLLWTGVGISCAFVGLRFWGVYGDPNVWRIHEGRHWLTFMEFFNLTKYPPSLLFVLMTLGPALVVLWRSNIACDGGWMYRMTLTFGRVPFLFYVLHLYCLHLAYRTTGLFCGYSWAGTPRHPGMPAKFDVGSIGYVWLIALMTLVLLYPIVALFAKWKRESTFALFRYF